MQRAAPNVELGTAQEKCPLRPAPNVNEVEGSLMNTRLLLRSAALATLLTTIGHLTGSPHLLGSLWVPTNAQQGSDVVRAMQAYRFEAMGFETSVFDFYSGFGWQLGAYLLGHAISSGYSRISPPRCPP